MIKQWLRRFLGTDDLANKVSSLYDNIERQTNEVKKMRGQLTPMLEALGKILVRLDPILAQSEFDEKRKAESDKLGREAIDRLIAEDKARRHCFGEEN